MFENCGAWIWVSVCRQILFFINNMGHTNKSREEELIPLFVRRNNFDPHSCIDTAIRFLGCFDLTISPSIYVHPPFSLHQPLKLVFVSDAPVTALDPAVGS